MIAAAYSRALDRVRIADPGLSRLRNAARSTLACVLTAAIDIAWAVHHDRHITVAALGALFAMIAPLFLREVRLSGWLASLSCFYVCACACFAVSAAVASHPLWRDAVLLLVVFTGMFCQPYGPRAVGCAFLALVACYLGLYLHPTAAQIMQMLIVSSTAPVLVALVGRVCIPMGPGRMPSLSAGAVFRSLSCAIARIEAGVPRVARRIQAGPGHESRRIASLANSCASRAWTPAVPATVAAALAMLIGNGVSEERWMWAVISTFVIFFGTTSREDTLRRVGQRLAGTLAGALASSLLVTMFRHVPQVLMAAMALSVFGWAYYILHAYARGVFFITVLIGLVYGQLGFAIVPLSALRIEEVVAGCAISVVVAVLMMPSAAMRRIEALRTEGR